jgi:hypothetical protein
MTHAFASPTEHPPPVCTVSLGRSWNTAIEQDVLPSETSLLGKEVALLYTPLNLNEEQRRSQARNALFFSPLSLNLINLFSQTWAKCKGRFFKRVLRSAKEKQEMVSFKDQHNSYHVAKVKSSFFSCVFWPFEFLLLRKFCLVHLPISLLVH